MKFKNVLLLFFLLTSLFLTTLIGKSWNIVGKDSSGLIVDYKEKYGNFYKDTCTVIMTDKIDVILLKENGNKVLIPTSNLSWLKFERKKENDSVIDTIIYGEVDSLPF